MYNILLILNYYYVDLLLAVPVRFYRGGLAVVWRSVCNRNNIMTKIGFFQLTRKDRENWQTEKYVLRRTNFQFLGNHQELKDRIVQVT